MIKIVLRYILYYKRDNNAQIHMHWNGYSLTMTIYSAANIPSMPDSLSVDRDSHFVHKLASISHLIIKAISSVIQQQELMHQSETHLRYWWLLQTSYVVLNLNTSKVLVITANFICSCSQFKHILGTVDNCKLHMLFSIKTHLRYGW